MWYELVRGWRGGGRRGARLQGLRGCGFYSGRLAVGDVREGEGKYRTPQESAGKGKRRVVRRASVRSFMAGLECH